MHAWQGFSIHSIPSAALLPPSAPSLSLLAVKASYLSLLLPPETCILYPNESADVV